MNKVKVVLVIILVLSFTVAAVNTLEAYSCSRDPSTGVEYETRTAMQAYSVSRDPYTGVEYETREAG